MPKRSPANQYTPLTIDPRSVRHRLCVDHVAVDGLAEPVCILRGQDRDAVVADAVELAGGRTLAGDGRRGS